MKKKLFFGMAAIAAIFFTASCNKEQVSTSQQSETEDSTIRLYLNGAASVLTRADDPYTINTQTEGKEDTIKDVQIFVFDENDVFEKYVHVEAWETETKDANYFSIGAKKGKKFLYVICNGPDLSGTQNLNTIYNTIIDLETYNDPDEDFVMFGTGECDITKKETVPCEITVKRYVSKVYIARVKNNLSPQFGNITLEYAFLANVIGKVKISGSTGENGQWYNKYGRINETPLVSEHIINGSTYKAQGEKVTFHNLEAKSVSRGDSTSVLGGMYCYSNLSTTAPEKFSSTFSSCCTKLIIAATVNSQLNYYSIDLGKIERNSVYAVYLTVSGLGSSDPAESVVKGNIQATIKVKDWVEGKTIIEEI